MWTDFLRYHPQMLYHLPYLRHILPNLLLPLLVLFLKHPYYYYYSNYVHLLINCLNY